MLIESSSDLISHLASVTMPNGIAGHEATLINGNAVVVTHKELALFRKAGDCVDPLGNGFIRSVVIPRENHIATDADQSPFIVEHRAGYVGLADGQVLLITLNSIQMFPSKHAALRNENQIVELSLKSD